MNAKLSDASHTNVEECLAAIERMELRHEQALQAYLAAPLERADITGTHLLKALGLVMFVLGVILLYWRAQ